MKFHEGKLYIEFQDMITAGVSSNTAKHAIYEKTWLTIKDPSDKRCALIDYASLNDRYKNVIIQKYGDPYKALESDILLQYMVAKPEDIDFLENYKVSESRFLPADKLKKYISAVSVLNFCSVMAEKKKLAGIGVSNMRMFWELVIAYIKRSGADLPTNIKRLQAKLNQYLEVGPQCLISAHWQNNRAAKVKDEVSVALLLEMIAHSNQFDDRQVAKAYNKWADEKGYKKITRSTVWNYRHQNKLTVDAGRYGVSVWHDKYDKTIHREQASQPLLLINSDDNHLDLFFKTDGTNYCRLKLIVVIDTYKNYPLGWAIGNEVTVDLVREAYLNAVHHIKEITGGYYYWHQIQADKWAEATLGPWYTKQAHFISAKVPGNKRKNRIESSFGNHGWHQLLKMYPNYNGHNITAKSKTNSDRIKANAKDFPHVSFAHTQVTHFMQALRQWRKDEIGPTRQQMWLQAWKDMPDERKRHLGDSKRILLFGKKHDWTNTIDKDGIKPTLNGQRIIYNIPEADYKVHNGKTLNVAFDPYDQTKILAYNDDCTVRIVCPINEKCRDVIMDMQEGDRTKLNNLLNEKKRISQWALFQQQKRKEKLIESGIQPESLLMAGIHNKELQQYAEQKYLEEVYAVMPESSPLTKNNWADLNLPDED